MNYAQPNFHWLAAQRALQDDAFGRTFPIDDPDDLADYVTEMHTALIVELAEFMNEVGWKTWAAPRGWVNRDAAVGELVDVAHFLGNLLLALGVDDDEFAARYRTKQEVNRRRQKTGYDGVSGKCPGCRRAYDDVGVTCIPNGRVVQFESVPATVTDAWCDRLDRYV